MVNRNVSHYEITQWADFARGLVTGAAKMEMQRHLASGCTRCSRIETLLNRVVKATAADAACEVPEDVTQAALAIFSLQQPGKAPLLPRILARLVYDSFLQPLPAGVRAQQRLSRQAMYEAGDYCVDLRLEQEPGSSQVTMVGQVADRGQARQPLQEAPVMLMSGREVVARAVSNRFGEFQIEYQPRKSLRLHVSVEGDAKRIEVPLDALTSAEDERER